MRDREGWMPAIHSAPCGIVHFLHPPQYVCQLQITQALTHCRGQAKGFSASRLRHGRMSGETWLPGLQGGRFGEFGFFRKTPGAPSIVGSHLERTGSDLHLKSFAL